MKIWLSNKENELVLDSEYDYITTEDNNIIVTLGSSVLPTNILYRDIDKLVYEGESSTTEYNNLILKFIEYRKVDFLGYRNILLFEKLGE